LLTANALIDLPFGKGKRYLNHGGAVDKLVGGWEFNPIFTARSGIPFSVVCTNCSGANRPTQIGDPFANLAPGRLLNAAAFSNNTATFASVTNAAGNTIFFGRLGRNTFRGPHFFSTDLSLLKTTALTERLRMQIGFQFFNLFNHANFT